MNNTTHKNNSQEKIYKFPNSKTEYEVHYDLGKGKDFSTKSFCVVIGDIFKVVSTKILR